MMTVDKIKHYKLTLLLRGLFATDSVLYYKSKVISIMIGVSPYIANDDLNDISKYHLLMNRAVVEHNQSGKMDIMV